MAPSAPCRGHRAELDHHAAAVELPDDVIDLLTAYDEAEVRVPGQAGLGLGEPTSLGWSCGRRLIFSLPKFQRDPRTCFAESLRGPCPALRWYQEALLISSMSRQVITRWLSRSTAKRILIPSLPIRAVTSISIRIASVCSPACIRVARAGLAEARWRFTTGQQGSQSSRRGTMKVPGPRRPGWRRPPPKRAAMLRKALVGLSPPPPRRSPSRA